MKISKPALFIAMSVMMSGVMLNAQEQKKQAAPVAAAPAPAVIVEKVVTLMQEDFKKCVGVIESLEHVEIPVRISGILENVAFKEGAMVRKGELLFEVEDDVYVANLNSAKANLKRLTAEYEYARSELERYTRLKEKSIASQADYENAVRQYRATEAQIDEAKAAVSIAELNLSYTKIYAPLTGRIGEKVYSVGNYVTPSTSSLATVVQVDPIRVCFSLKLTDYYKYISGQNLMEDSELILDLGNGIEIKDGISFDFIDNKMDRSTATLMIYLKCENKNDLLIPGGYITVKIAKKYKKPMPAVPVISIMTDAKGSYVYIVDKNNVAQRRNIKMGKQVGSLCMIEEGVTPGEVVVTDGVHKVILNAPVNPVQAVKAE